MLQVGGPGRALAAPGPDAVTMIVPNDKVGLIIGKGGETIKNLQNRSGARIQVQFCATVRLLVYTRSVGGPCEIALSALAFGFEMLQRGSL